MTLGGIAVRAIVLGTMSISITAVTAERASAQPRYAMDVRPEFVTAGTRGEAVVSGARAFAALRLFASVTQGTTTVGPFATQCGDVRFTLQLAGRIKYLRLADAVADSAGAATLRFRFPARLPDRFNGVKVYFQSAAVLAALDGSGNCTLRTATSNVDCCTVQLDLD